VPRREKEMRYSSRSHDIREREREREREIIICFDDNKGYMNRV